MLYEAVMAAGTMPRGHDRKSNQLKTSALDHHHAST